MNTPTKAFASTTRAEQQSVRCAHDKPRSEKNGKDACEQKKGNEKIGPAGRRKPQFAEELSAGIVVDVALRESLTGADNHVNGLSCLPSES